MTSNIRSTIESLFRDALEQSDKPAPDQFPDGLLLLGSGLDSLGFAILVTQLEQTLGYDPFTIMEEAVYPTTFGQFVAIYEKFAPTN